MEPEPGAGRALSDRINAGRGTRRYRHGRAQYSLQWQGRAMMSRAMWLKPLGRRVAKCLEARRIPVDALYLFGSHVRGEATADSDIDILMVSPRFEAQGFWPRCRLVGTGLGALPEPVQVYPVTMSELRNPEPGGFLEAIGPQLKLLYHRPRRRSAGRVRLVGEGTGMRLKPTELPVTHPSVPFVVTVRASGQRCQVALLGG